ncbi:hypothetical protein FJY63_07540 [Candidatus Sumerlaeota bacterium]|nr:hypothetical protein [Candidatus Sumerlaeota bacterium]
MTHVRPCNCVRLPRREFIGALGAATAGLALSSASSTRDALAESAAASATGKSRAKVVGAFLYPPTESLKKQGYYSWPGAGFDAEGRQKQHMARIAKTAQKLGMDIAMEAKPLHENADVDRFIQRVKSEKPDGLLLIAFLKAEWSSIARIVKETSIPTVAYATLGILLNPNINELYRTNGVYVINSLDNHDAIEYGMRMIKTRRWMRESRIVSVGAETGKETVEGHLGTRVINLGNDQLASELRQTLATRDVESLARKYWSRAKKAVEPTKSDVLDAARVYFAIQRAIERNNADAFMMDCLGAIRVRRIPPPCMPFMTMRDRGIAAGCQNELGPTMTQMLLSQLFGRPGFQQNASSETEKNHYYGAHCTAPTKMDGLDEGSERYVLRNHAESGIGVAPQVLFRIGREITMAAYIPGKEPQMVLYTGKIVARHEMPPTGGCRSNLELVIDDVKDVCDVKGMHQTIIYGNYARQIRAFCQMYGISVVT